MRNMIMKGNLTFKVAANYIGLRRRDSNFANAYVFGVCWGGVYSLSAWGYNRAFSQKRRIHFRHGLCPDPVTQNQRCKVFNGACLCNMVGGVSTKICQYT